MLLVSKITGRPKEQRSRRIFVLEKTCLLFDVLPVPGSGTE